MYFVYLLRSVTHSEKTYVGYTINIHERLQIHNDGKSLYTTKYKPWKLCWYACFIDESAAISFEKYLKSGSGKAFAKNHFLQACPP